jgi:hypothetical protein
MATTAAAGTRSHDVGQFGQIAAEVGQRIGDAARGHFDHLAVEQRPYGRDGRGRSTSSAASGSQCSGAVGRGSLNGPLIPR